ncbi:MAG TPA: plastocyanin/azurin family copper-binding protein [Candidatus Binatia bacterium]|nr:plastocyanin/azurin family copper-binding protein [Candidatus Binatia bacterium]
MRTKICRGLAYSAAAALSAAPLHAGSIGGTATVDGSAAVGGVVALEGAPEKPAPSSAPRAVMDQKNLAFVPALLPVVAGTTVEFTNSDHVQHNVFSPSEVGGKFNLGTYGPGAARSVTFSKPGEVLVLCNIHMEMEARILVLKDPYFSPVGTDGRFEIRDVPAGTYALRLWRGGWLSFRRTVEVSEIGALTVEVVAEP